MNNQIEKSKTQTLAVVHFLKTIIKEIVKLNIANKPIAKFNTRLWHKLLREKTWPFDPMSYPSGAFLKEYNSQKKQYIEHPKETTFTFTRKMMLEDGNHMYDVYDFTYSLDDFDSLDLTTMHIMYNRLRHNRQHTKDDSTHVDSYAFKAIQERIFLCFPLLERNIFSERTCHATK